jgi:hypothetical protein
MGTPTRTPLVAHAERRGDDYGGDAEQQLGPVGATRTQRIIALAGLAAAAVIVIAALAQQGFSVKDTFEAIQSSVAAHPTAGPLIFIAAYAVAAVVLIPGEPSSSAVPTPRPGCRVWRQICRQLV